MAIVILAGVPEVTLAIPGVAEKAKSSICTVTSRFSTTAPLVPVMVMVKVPALVADSCSVEEPVPPELNGTLF